MTNSCYDIELDYRILEIIDSKNFAQFNQLKKNLKLDSNTLNNHLKFLQENGIIKREENSPGYSRKIEYTDIAKMKRKYKILDIDYSNKKRICNNRYKIENKIERKNRRKKIFSYILLLIAYNYMKYVKTHENKASELGMSYLDDEEIISFYWLETKKGFSIEDIKEHDFALDFFQSLFSSNEFKEETIRMLINEFNSDGIIKINIEGRYEIVDKTLENLLICCRQILVSFLKRIKKYWYSISKKPTKEEANWLYLVLGNKESSYFFQNIEYNRAKKKTIKDLFIKYHFDSKYHDPETIKNFINKNSKIFTKKGIKDYIKNEINYAIEDDYNRIVYNQGIRKLIDEGRYEFILNEIEKIVNPAFSNYMFDLKLRARPKNR